MCTYGQQAHYRVLAGFAVRAAVRAGMSRLWGAITIESVREDDTGEGEGDGEKRTGCDESRNGWRGKSGSSRVGQVVVLELVSATRGWVYAIDLEKCTTGRCQDKLVQMARLVNAWCM